MEVVLLENIKNLGQIGEIVKFAGLSKSAAEKIRKLLDEYDGVTIDQARENDAWRHTGTPQS